MSTAWSSTTACSVATNVCIAQDTPGLASEQVVKAICKYAAKQDQDYLQDQDLRRQYVMADSFDKRVDVCLFFLNPHFVKFEELALMKGMSKLGVPVIPVIAKVRLQRSACCVGCML